MSASFPYFPSKAILTVLSIWALVAFGLPSSAHAQIPDPVISVDLADGTVFAGASASIQFEATSTGPLTYQWYTVSDQGDRTALPAPPEGFSNTLAVTGLTTTTRYQAEASKGQTTVATRIATLTVLPQPLVDSLKLWSGTPMSQMTGIPTQVVVGQDKLVGISGNTWTTSVNGEIWVQSQQTPPIGVDLLSLSFGNGLFVTCGTYGRVYSSPDGVTWTQRDLHSPTLKMKKVVFGDGKFVILAVKGDGTAGGETLFTSPDGIAWTQVTLPNIQSAYGFTAVAGANDVSAGNDRIVCAFGGAESYSSGTYSMPILYLASADGGQAWAWKALNNDIPSLTSSPFICFGNGKFASPGATSFDGITWTPTGVLSTVTGVPGTVITGFLNGVFLGYPSFEASLGPGTFMFPSFSTDGLTWTHANYGSQYRAGRVLPGLNGGLLMYGPSTPQFFQYAVYHTGALSAVAPTIFTQPLASTATPRQQVTLSVSANGGGTMSYQWYEGAAGDATNPVAGATKASWVLPPVVATKNYWVRVTNEKGTIDSSAVKVSVATSFITPTGNYNVLSGHPLYLGYTDYWDGHWNGNTIIGVPVTYQWQHNGVDMPGYTSNTLSLVDLQSADSGTYRLILTNATGSVASDPLNVTVVDSAPTKILTQPVGGAIVEGQSWTFTCTATGLGVVNYKWYWGDSGSASPSQNPIATGPSFTLKPTVGTSKCWVRVTSDSGTVDSDAATVVVSPLATPLFQTQPVGATINSTQSYTLVASATSSVPVTYQWYTGQSGDTSHPISGATSSSYTPASLTGPTSFWVRASALATTSDSVTATIRFLPPVFVTQPVGATIDPQGSYTLQGWAPNSFYTSYQWYIGQSGDTSHPVQAQTRPEYTVTPLGETTSFWVRATALGASADSVTATVIVTGHPAPPIFVTQPIGGPVDPFNGFDIRALAKGYGPITYQWYEGLSGDTSHPVQGVLRFPLGYAIPGLLSESLPVAKSYWLRASSNYGNTDSDTATVTPRPPELTGGGLVPAGTAVAVELHSGPYSSRVSAVTSYQWKKDGVDIPGATSNHSYSFTAATVADTGTYWVAVTMPGGSFTSQQVAVVIFNGKSINGQNVATASVPNGTTATFDVDVSGLGLTYEWSAQPLFGPATTLDNSKWIGTHDRTLRVPQCQTSDSGRYVCKIFSNGVLAGQIDYLALTVDPPQTTPPTFAAHPQGATINPSQSYTLTAAAISDYAVTYQWYIGQSGDTSKPVAGATSNTLTTSALTSTTSFWVRATAQEVSANSATATLTVSTVQSTPPVFVFQPTGAVIGQSQSFTVNSLATSQDTVSYQWYIGPSGDTSKPIAQALYSSYTTPLLIASTSYWVRATNAHGASTDSITATVTVSVPPNAPAITGGGVITHGKSVTFAVVDVPTNPATYQWQHDGVNIDGATSSIYSIAAASFGVAGYYQVVVTTAKGSITSGAKPLVIIRGQTVNRLYKTTTAPLPWMTSVTLDVVDAVGPSLGYEWTHDTGPALEEAAPFTGTRSRTLTITSATPMTPVYYMCNVYTNGVFAGHTDPIYIEVSPPKATTFVVTPKSALVFPNQPTVLTALATGEGTVTYQWYKGVAGDTSHPLVGAPSTINGQSGSHVSVLSLSSTCSYWVRASTAYGEASSDTATLTYQALMTATYNGDTRLQLHKNIVGTVKAPGATSFNASGLPAGVFINSYTGEFYGSPTAVGKYTARVSASNGSASSAVLTIPMEVAPLSNVVTGSFVGLIDRSGLYDKTLGGQITLTITSSGIYSGRFNIGNVSHSVIGISTTTQDGGVHGQAGPAPSAPRPHTSIEFFVNPTDGSIDGLITQDAYPTSGQTPFHAVRNAWVAGGLRSTPYTGTITAALQTVDLTPIAPGDYPQGMGILSAVVGANGSVLISARLADNTVVTASSIMGQDHSIPLYAMLYGGTGSLHGWQTVAADSTYGNVTNGKLTWAKNPQSPKTATRSYANGFPVLEVNLTGSKLVVPGKGQIELGLQDKADNAVIDFVHTSLVQSNSTPFRITAANVAQMHGGTNVTMAIDKGTGKFSGTWSPTGFTAPFFGAFIPRLNAGVGCFQFGTFDNGKAATVSGAVWVEAAR